jgi:predicted metalloendopeptidase
LAVKLRAYKYLQLSLPNEERRNVTKLYNAMTVHEMQSTFPTIPWLTYFNNILPENVHITRDEVIIVAVPSFITGLEKLIAQTPKRCVALKKNSHWLSLCIVHKLIPYLCLTGLLQTM